MSRLHTQLKELGVEVDAQLFELSFTHRSYAYENGGIESNERLEFLGDAVLQIVVTEHIFRSYPELPEGHLAKLRARVVSSVALSAGADAAGRFIHRNLDHLIVEAERSRDYADYKTALQELCAQQGWALPRYDVSGEGPDHQRVFTAVVIVDDQPRGHGTAPSKKHAEQSGVRGAHRCLSCRRWRW